MKKKKKEPYYTTGEIFRSKLMLSKHGVPYVDKPSVLRAVRKLKFKRVPSPHGLDAYVVPLSEIHKHNKRNAPK